MSLSKLFQMIVQPNINFHIQCTEYSHPKISLLQICSGPIPSDMHLSQASVIYKNSRIRYSFKAISKMKPLSKCYLNQNTSQVTVRIGIFRFPFPHTMIRTGSFQIMNYFLKGTLKLVNSYYSTISEFHKCHVLSNWLSISAKPIES